MENDCEIYVDPEEDEVFFGCVSDREKTACAKLVRPAELNPSDDKKLTNVLKEVIVLDNECEKDENSQNDLSNEESTKISKDDPDASNPVISDTVMHNSLENMEEPSKPHSNTSVELDHNYSTPMKQTIDKSILTTPKSVVKADKDGGFLKVLSEIALVKAEAEGDKSLEEKREDEDKENKVVSQIPEIKVTEATPEKGIILSPPKNVNTELRRFRIIYNSPQNEENTDNKSKCHMVNFESERNFKNKVLDQSVMRKSIDLIDLNVTICDSNEADTEKTVEKDPKSSDTKMTPRPVPKPPKGLRFSKEARKIVEVLKKSSLDDTFNFTIPEIDIEDENSFLSPEPVPMFDDTVTAEVKVEKSSPRILTRPADNRIAIKSKTVEKYPGTPVIPQSKLQHVKYFSDRKIYNKTEREVEKKCVKKLPMEEKKPLAVGKGGRLLESNVPFSSRIPVFGVKSSKIPHSERVGRPVTGKVSPSKTPSGKSYRNSKFNHIESPINAYIHNKPTSLVCNVKPEVKKGSLTKVPKVQITRSVEKVKENQPRKFEGPKSAVHLPFVEYKNATPYKIEKSGESRLPRLAPTMMKILVPHSPRVVKHEGRFFMNSPRKGGSAENTIVADQNEVSVVVSQPAQKSNTIK